MFIPILAGKSVPPVYFPTTIAGLWAAYTAGIGTYKDAGVTPAANGETVQQWNDRSGNGRNLAQATGTRRPTLVNNSGLWSVDGSGAANCAIGIAAQSLPEPFTVCGRFSTLTAGQAGDVWGGAGSESRCRNETAQLHCYAGNNTYTGAGITMPTDGTRVAFTIRFNGVNTKLRKDAAADITATLAPAITTLTEFYITNRGDLTVPWNGKHYEYLIYSRALADAEIAAIHSYFAANF
jgi:hypothetical protein